MKDRKLHTESRPDLMNEDLLWGAPRSSDGAFLVSIRGRLNNQTSGLWLSYRKTIAMVGAAAVLLVGVWFPGRNSGQRVLEQVTTTTLNATVEEFVVDDADPLELADYLGVESAQIDSVSEDTETPSESDQAISVVDVTTDEILELDEQDFDLVIAEIQETDFF